MSETHFDWSHVPAFLAVVRAGGLRSAAAELAVSHATVRRQLDALEAALGLRLFDRRGDGLHLTPEGAELVTRAEAMEQAAYALTRQASGLTPSLDGWLHVSAPDLLMSELLAPAVAAFSRAWPQIRLRVQTTYALADLGNRDADVALRILPVGTPPEEALIATVAAPLHAAVYGVGQQWIGWDGDAAAGFWPDLAALPAVGAYNNVYLQRSLCAQGLGLATLPCFMAPAGVERRTDPVHVADVWILVHPDQRRNPRGRLFREAMLAALSQIDARGEGRAVGA